MSIHSKITGSVGHLILDRTEKANAYDRAHLEALEHAVNELQNHCSVVIIRSNHPSVFCAGADLHEMKDASPEDAARLYSQAVFSRLARSPFVSIAVVEGLAIGGGFELALATDIRIVGQKGGFRLPETSLGIIPAAGGCTRLTALLGASIAKQVILAGKDISAHQAIQWGLAIDGGQSPIDTATQLAQDLSTRSTDALLEAKRIIDLRAEDGSLSEERKAQSKLYALRADE